MIARNKALKPQGLSFQQRIAEGSRLRQELNIARARGDKAEVSRIRVALEEFNALHGIIDSAGASGSDTEVKGLRRMNSEGTLSAGIKRDGSGEGSMLEEISRRNRQLNHENARRLQVLEAERRRKAALERKREEEAKKDAYVFGDSVFELHVLLTRLSRPNAQVPEWTAEQEIIEKNPDLANKDIGTKMAHMVEIELPDF